jgi:hypothetical protein
MSMHNTLKKVLISGLLLFSMILTVVGQVVHNEVQVINWSELKKKVKPSPVSDMVKSTLLNVNKYGVGAWYTEVKNFKTDSTSYLELKSKANNNERRYRLPAGMAFGLAIAIKTGAYDEKITGVPVQEAQAKAIKMLTAVAYDHQSNPGRKVWGSDWQAAHWAYYCGYGAWLLWDRVKPADQKLVKQMLIFEANRLLAEPALFYKDRNGKELIPGDSKIEENAWNAELLYLAAVMMPRHANSKTWYQQSLAYMIAATAMPSDLNREQILHGKPIKDWLSGYNVEEPGIVINHDIIHPLYNALSSVVNAPIVFSLANQATPEAARFNMSKIYHSLINTVFNAPPYQKPGGTMYRKGQGQVYYPQGSDWGTEIFDSFANIDVAAWMYGLDKGEKYDAKYWASFHVKAVLDQQARFSDGHTYLNEKENSYYGKEAAIATRMASAWMSIWMQAQRPAFYSNK